MIFCLGYGYGVTWGHLSTCIQSEPYWTMWFCCACEGAITRRNRHQPSLHWAVLRSNFFPSYHIRISQWTRLWIHSSAAQMQWWPGVIIVNCSLLPWLELAVYSHLSDKYYQLVDWEEKSGAATMAVSFDHHDRTRLVSHWYRTTGTLLIAYR
jgi:hypothetical protein